MTRVQPWLGKPLLESLFILAPALVSVAAILLFHEYFTTSEVSTLWWIVLVLCIDVSHVYSTVFRLYWDRQTFQQHKRLLVIIPVAGFLLAVSVHLFDALLFWRILAYVAVYHFVRQQYGFVRLYARRDGQPRLHRLIDAVAIYAATIYPLLYWHATGTEKIAWFVKGDFIHADLSAYLPVLEGIYFAIIAVYAGKELLVLKGERYLNLPKNLIMAGTYLSWYFGIVAFQGDLVFTLLNVVAHGIPYMALVWIYSEKKAATSFTFGVKSALIFIVVLFLLAYLEENLWDSLVWNDHPEIFIGFNTGVVENPVILSVLVSLLVLPQVTHYVLDGFIWRLSKDRVDASH